jgi:hypothetical protein
VKLLALASLAVLAGCPDDPPKNAHTVWLATDMVETRVKLIDHEPPPF